MSRCRAAFVMFVFLASLAGAGVPRCLAAGPRLEIVAGKAPSGAGFIGGELREPFGVDADPDGNLYIVELGGGRVLQLAKDGTLRVIAGNGEKGLSGDGGPAAKAVFNGMHNLAAAPTGDLFLADTWNSAIRRIDAKSQTVSTVVGTGKKGFAGDGGQAAAALCGHLYCVALEPNGRRLFLADLDNRRIRVVALADGTIDTLAGNGEKGVPRDGAAAKEQPLVDPRAVACDSQGNVYVLERSGHALRVVDPQGRIRTVAGTGKSGPPQDDAPALEATLNGPKHLCIDRDDRVIIADAENHVIVRYDPKSGRVTRIAGTGRPGRANLAGTPREVELNRPHGVFVDARGTLYIVDTYHNRLLKWVEAETPQRD